MNPEQHQDAEREVRGPQAGGFAVIMRRLKSRSEEERARMRARVDAADLGHQAYAMGHDLMEAGNYLDAKRWLRVAAEHGVPGAEEALDEADAVQAPTGAADGSTGFGGPADRGRQVPLRVVKPLSVGPFAGEQAEAPAAYRELAAARLEARRIKEQARREAAKLIAEATRQAQAVLADARKEAAGMATRVAREDDTMLRQVQTLLANAARAQADFGYGSSTLELMRRALVPVTERSMGLVAAQDVYRRTMRLLVPSLTAPMRDHSFEVARVLKRLGDSAQAHHGVRWPLVAAEGTSGWKECARQADEGAAARPAGEPWAAEAFTGSVFTVMNSPWHPAGEGAQARSDGWPAAHEGVSLVVDLRCAPEAFAVARGEAVEQEALLYLRLAPGGTASWVFEFDHTVPGPGHEMRAISRRRGTEKGGGWSVQAEAPQADHTAKDGAAAPAGGSK
ncbi:hypothetical protein ABZW47_31080 [Streptomyces sp. NPDC004549]|uniref:DivIVA domain-containing protein n=1 Tax=Streptomyces sp. NPDC004549 TaxID=3154283 RepID=UPI0033AE2CF8